MAELVVNLSDLDALLARPGLADLFGALDAKRPTAWAQYGYPEALSFDHFFRAYKRGGAGFGAVHRLLDRCWLELPRIKRPDDDEESEWEMAVGALLDSFGGWQKLRDLDRRNMIGRYAGLIYRVADGKPLRDPLGRGKVVDLVPVYESQLRPVKWDTNSASTTFGQVTMWQYRMQPPPTGTTQIEGRPDQWVDVHPSRVQILAEGSVGDPFDGVPLLEAGFNHLVDLEKIAGGSAEGFLKNSARTISLEFEAQGSPQAIANNPDGTPSGKTVAQAAEEKFARLNRNIDAAIVTQGGKASTLQTQMADPSKPFEVAANLFAASVQIPFTILFGQQTGRLASDQDQADMVARCRSRQVNELTPMVEQLVTRLQACGAIEAGEFEVEWKPLDAPSDEKKVETLGKLTKAAKDHFDSGGAEPLFDRDELRKYAGYEQKQADDEFREDDPPDPLADPGRGGSQPPAPAPAPRLRKAA